MWIVEAIVSSPWTWVALVLGMLAGMAVFFACNYEKVGPNEVLIVSGRKAVYGHGESQQRKNFCIYHGGGTLVWPVREKVDRLSLELMTLEIKTPHFYTKYGVPIVVDGIAQIKVKSDDIVSIMTAAEMFLSKSRSEMNEIALQMMSGHLRAVISTMPFEEIHANPEAFAQTVQRLTSEDLANMGIQVVSFTIREVQDPKGYLQAIGRPQMATVEKNALLGECNAKRDATVGQALASRESKITEAQALQESELARISAELAVAESEKERNVKAHAFRAQNEAAKAESDLAYELQKAKTEQLLCHERLGVDLVQKKKQIEVEQSEIQRCELELVHKVQKPAEAERRRLETLAEAERAKRRALSEADAEAERVRGVAQADVIRARGDAEAEAIRQRALAEADGLKAKLLAEAEGMKEKAVAYQQYNEAAVSQMLIERLPEIAAAVASPLSKIDRITLVNSAGGNGTGIDQVTRGVTDVLSQLPAVAEMLGGINLPELIKRIPGQHSNGNGKHEVVPVADAIPVASASEPTEAAEPVVESKPKARTK